jgi:hypothetical protein
MEFEKAPITDWVDIIGDRARILSLTGIFSRRMTLVIQLESSPSDYRTKALSIEDGLRYISALREMRQFLAPPR